jgi:multisubunit Na+/H+ antiporter MnhB subunit
MREMPAAPLASASGTGQARSAQSPRSARAAWRVAAVAILLAVTVIGLRTHGTFSHTPNPTAAGASGLVLVTVLATGEGVAIIAFILVLVMARPQPEKKEEEEDDDRWRPPFPWWAKIPAVLIALAALATPFVVLFTRKQHKKPIVPPAVLPGVPLGGPGRVAASGSGAVWPLIAGMVIAIAVVLTLTILSRRKRARDRSPHRGRRITALAEGLAAGRDALQAGTEPRAAIIACYAALERGFAAAGSAPAVADTPAEVLTRATEAGLVRSASAETLTSLFRRARYSSEPMTLADSAAAANALEQMRTDLEDAAELTGARS